MLDRAAALIAQQQFLLLKSFSSAAAMKPGVAWPDMHRLMWRILLTVESRLRCFVCRDLPLHTP